MIDSAESFLSVLWVIRRGLHVDEKTLKNRIHSYDIIKIYENIIYFRSPFQSGVRVYSSCCNSDNDHPQSRTSSKRLSVLSQRLQTTVNHFCHSARYIP